MIRFKTFALASGWLASAPVAWALVPVPIPRIAAEELQPALAKGMPEMPPPSDKPDDPAKTVERITQAAETIGQRLQEADTGEETRKKQDQLLKEIDSLLKPPPPMGGGGGGGSSSSNMNQQNPMPMGNSGGSGANQPKPMGSGGSGNSGGRQRPERSPRDPNGGGMNQPMPMGSQPMPMPMGTQPMPATGTPGEKDPKTPSGPGSGGSGSPALPLEDPLTKQVWGHLPEKLRQQVSQYYREQYMPRYSELLKQYYSSLAEREKAPKK